MLHLLKWSRYCEGGNCNVICHRHLLVHTHECQYVVMAYLLVVWVMTCSKCEASSLLLTVFAACASVQ